MATLLSFLAILALFSQGTNGESTLQIQTVAPVTCALLIVYGSRKRYIDEVEETTRNLKSLNPQVLTILVTNNPVLNHEDSPADKVKVMGNFTGGFFARTKLITEIGRLEPSCDVFISMDSHVRICTSNLQDSLHKFYSSGALLGTNIEHAPFAPWCSSPLVFEQAKLCKKRPIRAMPHNFVIVWNARSKAVEALFEKWLQSSHRDKRDDQKPLYAAMRQTNFPHTRLREGFAMALKRAHHRNLGFYPRFTYLVEGNVTMIHSYKQSRIPKGFNDICSFLNSKTSPRMVFEKNERSKYSFIDTIEQCFEELDMYPQICNDTGLSYGANWLQNVKRNNNSDNIIDGD